MSKPVPHLLRDLVEPLAANVYFAPEAQENYKALGLSYIPSYFRSRSACMGDVVGEMVVAAFGVFNPAIVLPAIEEGRKVSVDDILDARQRGAIAGLTRILDGVPDGVDRLTELLRQAGETSTCEGHSIYAGLRSLGFPGDPMGDFWRAADLLREHRGDSHIAAWIAHGFDATEISLITEPYIGLPMRTYSRSRAWSDADFDAALERMSSRGYFEDGQITQEGPAAREAVEDATDLQETSIVEAIGDDFDELCGILEPWADAIREQKGYPSSAGQIVGRRG